ncbi:pre-mRNA splicing factor [Dichomitus squalens]|nr:pre-mRNA splicing factor [Dichomitus squalens]
MDALMAEIALKRKALDVPAPDGARPTKYMRRGEIERLKEEQERREKEQKEEQRRLEREREEREREERRRQKAAAKASSSRTSTKSPHPEGGSSSGSPAPDSVQSFNMSNEETIRRLRAKGQPIRLFGETDKERRLRLRALELIEEKDHERQGGQNDFKKALEDVENIERQMKDRHESDRDRSKKKDGEASLGSEILDLNLVKTDPDKLYPIIYYALKRALKEWEQWMDERPEHVKHTTQGKNAAATQRQSADNLKPLFKLLRARNLPADMLARIAEIVHYMQRRQYQRANDSYLRLSIGNAPWPIGVTMVGIHERSAREKISADQVAHVLNDEVSRKYIQSLKRILTFAQTKYPPEDATQLMG